MKKLLIGLGIALWAASGATAQSLEQGIVHLKLEQYERAKNIFKNLSKSEAKKGKPFYYLGEAYLEVEKLDSARYAFMEGIKADDGEALNYVGMGKLSFANNTTEGKSNFAKALEMSKSKDSKVLSAIAKFYTTGSNKDHEQAIALLEKAIKVDAKNVEPLLLMGDVYLEKNNASKATEYYNAALKLNDKSPEAIVRKGKIYVRAKNYEAGAALYDEAITVDPNYPPAYREKGELYSKFGKYPKAIEAYKKYMSMTDKSYDTDLRYGQFLYQAKDYANAVAVLGGLSAKDNNIYLYRMLAYSCYETGDYDKGMDNMSKFWSNASEERQIAKDFEYYGKLLIKKGQDSLGIWNLKKAIDKDSTKTDLYGDIATYYMTKKRYKDAASTYAALCAKGLCKANDYLNMGKSYYQDRQYANADSAFKQLTALSPTWANGYLWRAKANHIQDPEIKLGIAEPHYEKFIELAKAEQEKYKKDLIEAYKYVGAYNMTVKKNKVTADAAWIKLKELDPTFKEVDTYLNAKY